MQSKPEKDDHYKVDIAALSETRFAGKGNLRETEATHFFGADAAAKSGGRQGWDLLSQQHTSINSPAFLRVSTIAL